MGLATAFGGWALWLHEAAIDLRARDFVEAVTFADPDEILAALRTIGA